MLDPVGISLIADMIMDRLPDEVDALAGIEIGGIPLAIAGSARSYQLMITPLNALIVRKRIEGPWHPTSDRRRDRAGHASHVAR